MQIINHGRYNQNMNYAIIQAEHNEQWAIMKTSDPEMIQGKRNSELSDEERAQKMKLKQALRIQTKINRLETMIRHARSRKDSKIELEAKENLKVLMRTCNVNEVTEGGILSTTFPVEPLAKSHNIHCLYYQKSKKWLLHITARLFRRENMDDDCIQDGQDYATIRHEQTVQLLSHMTKGTQDRTMFQEPTTLWGYTRQKFFVRAMLLCNTFRKLQPCIFRENHGIPLHQNELINSIWTWIKAGNIRQACSLGCGPGNDAVGLIAFLQAISGNDQDLNHHRSDEIKTENETRCSLDRILLLDWAIDDWVKTILGPLQTILGEEKAGITIDWGHFDVSQTLSSHIHCNVSAKMHQIEASDVYLISYLLTETRGLWELFFQQLIVSAKSRSLFYLAEPTPWQLHRFKELFHESMEFIWLDSSMFHPALQSLDRRGGPAVLLGVRK